MWVTIPAMINFSNLNRVENRPVREYKEGGENSEEEHREKKKKEYERKIERQDEKNHEQNIGYNRKTEYKKYKHLSHLQKNDITIENVNPGKKPGGQNVNRNKTAVILRVDILDLNPELLDKLPEFKKRVKVNDEGIIEIRGKTYKKESQNFKDVHRRLNNEIERVLNPNPNRKSEGEREKKREEIQDNQNRADRARKDAKRRRGKTKRDRQQSRIPTGSY